MTDGMGLFAPLLAGELPERVPLIVNLLEQGAAELGMGIEEYYSRGEHVAEAQLRLRAKYGYDSLAGIFYLAREAELLGCRRLIHSPNGPPTVGELIIRTPGDIERLTIPDDLSAHPLFQEQLHCIRLLRQEAGGNYPILAAVTASFSLPAMLMGMERWLELFLTGPPGLCRELLEKCSLFCARQVEALRAAGADLVAYVNPVASASVLTVRQFEQLALDWLKADVARTGTAGLVYFNGGGRINPLLTTIAEQTGIGAYYLNPMDDIVEAKRALAGRGLVVGTINDIKLIDWTPAEVSAEVERLMAAGAPGGGFLCGTLVMPCAIPERNIAALVAAARRFGAYRPAGAAGSVQAPPALPVTTGAPPRPLVACGILRREVLQLCAGNDWPVAPVFLPSALHVDFDRLGRALTAALDRQRAGALVLYGTCHPRMDDILAAAGAVRSSGQNCIELLLGRELFIRELAAGAFFLFEEWAEQWETIIGAVFGDNPAVLKEVFTGAHRYLLAVRTPCSGDFSAAAQRCSEACGLPLRWLDVSLDNLERALAELLADSTAERP